MISQYVIVQQPAQAAEQLFLLYHGTSDNPESMAQIGSWFARAFPQALVVSVGAPQPSGPPPGRQWFAETDAQDITSRQRVDAVLPHFVETVHYWQQQSGVKPAATALVGFSQGSTMVLEGISAQPELAGRVVAFSGRYITLPEQATTLTTIHLIHGEYDEKVPLHYAEEAARRLTALGGDVTLDIVEDLPHAIDDRSMKLALDHLRYTIPRRYFDEALGGSTPGDDVIIMM